MEGNIEDIIDDKLCDMTDDDILSIFTYNFSSTMAHFFCKIFKSVKL